MYYTAVGSSIMTEFTFVLLLVVQSSRYPLALAGGIQVILTWLLPMARAITLPGGLEVAAVRGMRPVDEESMQQY